MTNKQYSQTELFQSLCQKANVVPTKRQASKYRRGFGKLFNTLGGVGHDTRRNTGSGGRKK